MTPPDEDRSTILDPLTCRQLLATVRVGRIALPDVPSPTVLPVDFAVDDDRVIFRTVEGTKLDAAQSRGPASFQTDGFDPDHDTGWSVLVRGHLEEIQEPSSQTQAALAELNPLVGGDRPHVVALSIEEATGRRITQDPDWVRAHRGTNVWTDRDGSDLLG